MFDADIYIYIFDVHVDAGRLPTSHANACLCKYRQSSLRMYMCVDWTNNIHRKKYVRADPNRSTYQFCGFLSS